MKDISQKHLDLLCDIGELTSLLAGSADIETFLQSTVDMVSRHLKADVCSIYLYDEIADELVLRATIGLNPSAVGRVRMKVGEGLVGSTLQKMLPVREGCASRDPRFKYFEETGEDRFESFLSVPIQRGVEKIGVFVIQKAQQDYFDEIDTMALRATASQLAGAIENVRILLDFQEQPAARPPSALVEQLKLVSDNAEGIILVSGGVTSHVTILSQSLQIPLVIADRQELLDLPGAAAARKAGAQPPGPDRHDGGGALCHGGHRQPGPCRRFFSIGTNDFIQYLLAVDRASERVAQYYQPGHPSVLRSLAKIVSAAERAGKDVCICGEMAHQTRFTPFLLGIGVRCFSVNPRYLSAVKTAVTVITLAEAQAQARQLLEETTVAGVAGRLTGKR